MTHHRALDIGYGDDVAAVMTLPMFHLRAIPGNHRTVQPPEGSLAARGYQPLPKFPQAVTQTPGQPMVSSSAVPR